MNDAPISADIISANPLLSVVLVGPPYAEEFYGIAVNPNQPELLDMINAGLQTLVANGTFQALYEQWFEVAPPDELLNAILPGTAAAVAPDQCVHVVQAGDTLYSIAQQYGVVMNDMVVANDDLLSAGANTMMQIGWELVIPGCTVEPPGDNR